MRTADDRARVTRLGERERRLDISHAGASGRSFNAAWIEGPARQRLDSEYIDGLRNGRIGAGNLAHRVTYCVPRRIVPNDKSIADENEAGHARGARKSGFDRYLRPDPVWIADGERDSGRRALQSGNASKVSTRELSHTTMRSASLALSPRTLYRSR